MKTTKNTKPKTKFGRWLLNRMNETGFTCADVARELGTTRESVWNHITGVADPSFVWVVAYCWLFNSLENLNNIWYLTMEKDS